MKAILFFSACLVTFALKAQTVTGTIAEATGEPLPFASVILEDAAQKTLIITTADASGQYELALPPGFETGNLLVQYVGFSDFRTVLDVSSLSGPVDMRLEPLATALSEVSVTGHRRAVSFTGDKLVFDVATAGIGDGNNGLETLRMVPGMRLDKDDNLLFRGNADIQILINGRKSLLQGDALREYLRALKGSDIERVELIAQPSARYEASGTAGILNIVLKRNKGQGFGGNVYSWASYGEFFKQQQGGRLFFSDSLWTVNGNASYYEGKSFNRRRVAQRIELPGGTRHIDQHNEWLPRTVSKSANIAVERRFGRKQLLSTEWQFAGSESDEHTNGTTLEQWNGALVQSVALTQHQMNPTRRLTGNVFYQYKEGDRYRFDLQANRAQYADDVSGFQRNTYSPSDVLLLEGTTATRYEVTALQADNQWRLSDKMELESGLRYSHIDMDYRNQYETDQPERILVPEDYLVNVFSYREDLTSAYTQLSYDRENWGFMAGLRLERYRYKAHSHSNDVSFIGGTADWFPSASVNYKKDDHQYQFSYSRRIGRPDYLALNPYYQYIDAYTVAVGNPALKPQFYHGFQLGYTYKGSLYVGFYGYLYDDGFTSVVEYREDGNYNATYQANAAAGNRFGLSASLPYQKGIWSMQLSLDAAYASERSEIPGFSYQGEGFGYDLNFYQSLAFKTNWTVTLSGFYSGPGRTPNGRSLESYDMSVTARKSLLQKKLVLSGGCSNFLGKSRYAQVTEVGNVRTEWTNRWETRRFFLQLTWHFGGENNRKVKEASLEESSRIGK